MHYYYLYQIKNKVNDKIYIGIHKTKKLDDGYMGSGSRLKTAMKKYGSDNFEKTILAFFSSYDEMKQAEADIVTEEFLARDDVYNLVVGGVSAGFEYLNQQGMNLYGKNGTSGYGKENLTNQPNGKKLKDVLIEKGTWESYKENISSALLKMYVDGFENPFKGRKHSEETKEKIGKKNALLQLGEKNSQHGTKWIYSLSEKRSIKIKNTDPIPNGWKLGRKIKF